MELGGSAERRIEMPRAGGRPVVVQASELGIDVVLRVLDVRGEVIARAESPVIRTGRQTVFMETSSSAAWVSVLGKEHATHDGSVRITVRAAFSREEACARLQRALAAADMRYAQAHALAQSLEKRAGVTARKSFETAAGRYEALARDASLAPSVAAEIAHSLASLYYYDLSLWRSSAEWAQKSSAHFPAPDEEYGRARARAVLAAAWLEMATVSASDTGSSAVPLDSHARLEQARSLLYELAGFHEARGEHYDAALQINNIGLAFYYEADFKNALKFYSRALKEFERLGETPREALALQNIALCEWGLGRLTEALPRFDRALALMDPGPHPDLYLLTLNSSALAHYAAGKYDESLLLHGRAIDYAKRVENDYYLGRSFMGLGISYYAIGDRDLAEQFLRTALGILAEDLDGRGRVTSLRALAVIAHDARRFDEAVQFNRDALKLATAPSARARIKVRLGADYAAQGKFTAALEELDPVIHEPPGGDRLVQSEARLELGRALQTMKEIPESRRELEEALRGFRVMQSVAGEFDTRLELARLEAGAGREAEAIESLTAALALTDEIATQTGNPEYRASVVESLRPAQDLMVELQFARYSRALAGGRHDEAQRIARETLGLADATRAQSFEQILSQRFEYADPELAKQLLKRVEVLRALADRRFYLSTREDRSGPDDAVAATLREEIANLRARLGVINTELAAHAGSRGTGVAATTLDFARAPPRRAFVEYWLADSSSHAWVANRNGIRWIRLGGAADIRRLARQLHEAMRSFSTTPARTRAALLARLHLELIAPLAPLDGFDELVIAADGPLHIVPFAALRADQSSRYLVQQLSLAFVPALRFASSGDAVRAAGRGPGRMLLVADPVYQPDDERIAAFAAAAPSPVSSESVAMRSGDRDLRRLPSSAREAEAIRALMGAANVDVLQGLTATRKQLLEYDFSSYRYIHIAAHGEIDTEVPQLSALILGEFGVAGAVDVQRVWVADLLTKTFDTDLVVLSACSTSLGPEFAGEGPLGLRYAALARGARSVVSSLWPVADEITADLMTEMYRELTRANSASQALAKAMRELLNRRPSLDSALWAPYVIVTATSGK